MHVATRDSFHVNYGLERSFPSDWSFQRLADAPFSPRSDVLLAVDASAYRDTFDGVYRLYFIGGDVGYRCGLRELGVCSNEVWAAELRRASNTTRELSLTWLHTQAAAVPRLPFPPRCGSALLYGSSTGIAPDPPPVVAPRAEQLKAIVAGQLSYSDDSCQSPPVATNQVFYTTGRPDEPESWYEGDKAPFSPRRSQVHDDAFAHLLPRSMQDRAAMAQQTLVGGIRYEALRRLPSRNASALSRATMFADVWECLMPHLPEDPDNAGAASLLNTSYACAWTGRDGVEAPLGEPQWPADSIPFVTTGGATLTTVGGLGGLRLGGQTSRASIAAWQAQPALVDPPGDLELSLQPLPRNVSMMFSAYTSRAAQSLEDVMQARYHLPLQQTLEDAELNDPSAPYSRGSDYVLGHWSIDNAYQPPVPQISSVHLQEWSQANTPEQATPHLPQAASSLNTTRPLHRFRLRRFGHGMSIANWQGRWGSQAISGGRSGDEYFNDWIAVGPARCAPPDSPQFRRALGPGLQLYSMDDRYDAELGRDDVPEWGDATVACADGYHWEPAQRRLQLTLFCAPDSMWSSDASRSVPVCVKNAFNCTFPYMDLGYSRCVRPSPRIDAIDLAAFDELAVAVDDMTIRGVSLSANGQLIIRGAFFSYPVQVQVGGHDCQLPTLYFPRRCPTRREWPPPTARATPPIPATPSRRRSAAPCPSPSACACRSPCGAAAPLCRRRTCAASCPPSPPARPSS